MKTLILIATTLIFLNFLSAASAQTSCKYYISFYPEEASLPRKEAEALICHAENRETLESILRKHFTSNKGFKIYGIEDTPNQRSTFIFHSGSREIKYARTKAGKGLESEKILTLNDFKTFPGDSLFIINSLILPEQLKSRSFAKAGFTLRSCPESKEFFKYSLINRSDTLILESTDSLGTTWINYELVSTMDTVRVLHTGHIRFASIKEQELIGEWATQILQNKAISKSEAPQILLQYIELSFGPTSTSEVYRFMDKLILEKQ